MASQRNLVVMEENHRAELGVPSNEQTPQGLHARLDQTPTASVDPGPRQNNDIQSTAENPCYKDSTHEILGNLVQEVTPLYEEDECTICLEPILLNHRIGVIASCCPNKYYHDKCVVQWSSNSNSCPTCRKRFHKIDIFEKSHQSMLLRTVVVKDKLLPNDAINDIPREYVIPVNDSVPLTNNDDDMRQNGTHGVCAICTSSDYASSARSMINCNCCGSNFHANCLGISSVNNHDLSHWCCPICDTDQELILPNYIQRRPTSTSSTRHTTAAKKPRSTIIRRVSSMAGSSYNPSIFDSTTSDFPHEIRPTPAPIRNRRGLVIYNENHELDDDFLYDVEDLFDLNENLAFPDKFETRVFPSPVINGGVILRKELKARQNLSREEQQSWELFDEVRKNDVEPSQPSEGSSNSQDQDTTKKRRRRKKITPVKEEIIVGSSSDCKIIVGSSSDRKIVAGSSLDRTNTVPSRISSLINQLKTSPASVPFNINTCRQQQGPPPPPPLNLSDSPASISPASNSPMEFASNDSDTQYDSDVKILKKVKLVELTLDQKIEIQKYIRNNLRPLYKPTTNSTEASPLGPLTIASEEDYIKINKTISRKVYGHVLSIHMNNGELDQHMMDNFFKEDDPSKLKEIVDLHVKRELMGE